MYHGRGDADLPFKILLRGDCSAEPELTLMLKTYIDICRTSDLSRVNNSLRVYCHCICSAVCRPAAGQCRA